MPRRKRQPFDPLSEQGINTNTWPYCQPGTPPTPREIETVRALVRVGVINRVGAEMHLADATVKLHLAALRKRLEVTNTYAVIRILTQRGVL